MGPNSDRVLSLIRAIDAGQTEWLKGQLAGVAYVYGAIGDAPSKRLINVGDLPSSKTEMCRLDSIVGAGRKVTAHWECKCCDVAEDREFVFEGASLKEVHNIYALLG